MNNQRKKQRGKKSRGQRGKGRGRGNRSRFPVPSNYSYLRTNEFERRDNFVTGTVYISGSHFSTSIGVIPIHPFCTNGRIASVAKGYGAFKVRSLELEYIPLVGTSSDGAVGIGVSPHCNPITRTASGQLEAIMQKEQARLFPVWQAQRYPIQVVSKSYPVNACFKKDIPATILVKHSTDATLLTDVCRICLHFSLVFTEPTSSTDSTILDEQATQVLTSGGIKSATTTAGPTTGFVLTSTAGTIDVGELFVAPKLSVANTDVTTASSHNDAVINYAVDTGSVVVSQLFYHM